MSTGALVRLCALWKVLCYRLTGDATAKLISTSAGWRDLVMVPLIVTVGSTFQPSGSSSGPGTGAPSVYDICLWRDGGPANDKGM